MTDWRDEHSAPIKLVYAILLSAEKQQAKFIAIAEPRVMFWIDGTWQLEMTPPAKLFTVIIRRLGVMIGVLPPGQGKSVAGALTLQIGDARKLHYRMLLQRDEILEAYLQRVTPEEQAASVSPVMPTAHPFRS